jgi:hypothetical protein
VYPIDNEPSRLNTLGFWVNHRTLRSNSPLITPHVNGAGSWAAFICQFPSRYAAARPRRAKDQPTSSSSNATAAKNALQANRYAILRPNGIAPPSGAKSCATFGKFAIALWRKRFARTGSETPARRA